MKHKVTLWKSRLLLVSICALYLCFAQTLLGQKPNIIVIITDDQGEDMYAHKQPDKFLMPHVESLHQNGVRFTRAYSTSSVCQPTRFSIFSGAYPGRRAPAEYEFGIRHVDFNTRISEDYPSIAHHLKTAGYKTGIVGKMGAYAKGKGYVNADRNDPWDPNHRVNQQVVTDNLKNLHGFDYAASIYRSNINPGPGPLDVHNQEWITYGAIEFLNQYGDQPFFLAMSTTLMHAPGGLHSLQNGDPRATGAGFLTDEELALVQSVQPSRQSILDRCVQAGVPEGNAPLTWLDDGVGAILQKLEDIGQLDNTYIFYMTDHGDKPGKGDIYEESVNMPLFVRVPGTPEGQGRVLDAIVSSVDISATAYEAAGITNPDAVLPGFKYDGISFKSILDGSATSTREVAFAEIGYTRAVIKGDYKYISYSIPHEDVLDALTAGFDPYLPLDNPLTHYEYWWPKGKKHHGEDNYYNRDQLFRIYDTANGVDVDEKELINLAKDTIHGPAQTAVLKDMKNAMTDIIKDMPGSWLDLKLEIEIQGSEIVNDRDATYDLHIQDNMLIINENSVLTEDEYVIVRTTANLYGKFGREIGVSENGYELNYDTPGQVKLVRKTTLPEPGEQPELGTYKLVSVANPDLVMDTTGGTNGSSVILKTDSGADTQLWNLENAWNDTGYFRLVNVAYGKIMENYKTNTNIYNTDKKDWKKFTFINNNDGSFTIVCKHTGLALTAEGLVDGANVGAADYSGANSQKWTLVSPQGAIYEETFESGVETFTKLDPFDLNGNTVGKITVPSSKNTTSKDEFGGSSIDINGATSLSISYSVQLPENEIGNVETRMILDFDLASGSTKTVNTTFSALDSSFVGQFKTISKSITVPEGAVSINDLRIRFDQRTSGSATQTVYVDNIKVEEN